MGVKSLRRWELSKRGDNKRKRAREKRRGNASVTDDGPDRILVAGPLEMVQQGRTFSVHVDHTHPEYAAFREAMESETRLIPAEVVRRRAEIRRLAEPYHAFDVLFALWATYAVPRVGTLSPLADGGTSATCEYVAHILLERESPAPEREATPQELRQIPNPEEIGAIVLQILELLPGWFAYRQSGNRYDLDPWVELRTRLYAHRLTIRSFTYEWDERETLTSLFGEYTDELRRTIGFNVNDALSLSESLALLPRRYSRERGRQAREHAATLERWLDEFRAGRRPDAGDLFGHIEQLAQLSPREASKWITGTTIGWMTHGIGQTAAVSASELADDAEVDERTAQAFLDAFSIDFGARPDAADWSDDLDRAVGWEMEVMRQHPILHDGDGRYLPSSIESVFYGLRDRFTDALREPPATRKRFQRQRGLLVEERALAALSKALRAEWTHGSVAYRIRNSDGKLADGEADGILRADDLVVLIECKSGAMHASARRAAPARLERELRKLIVDAHHQLVRNEAALVDGRAEDIRDRHGGALSLGLRGITRVLRVVVTLEDLSPVSPAAWQLQEVGLVDQEHGMPWVVGVHELELICGLVESPAQLLHYVIRRQRAYRQRLWAMDEMDFFMMYLSDGLYFDDGSLEGSSLELASHTRQLDAYLYGQRGLTKPAKRPRQRVNGATRNLLQQIEATGAAGRMEAQLMILELSTASRERIAGGVRQLARRVAGDRKHHDMTLGVQDDLAVTIHMVPPYMKDGLAHRLTDHGYRRADASGLQRWLGLGYVAGRPPSLVAMSVLAVPSRLGDD